MNSKPYLDERGLPSARGPVQEKPELVRVASNGKFASLLQEVVNQVQQLGLAWVEKGLESLLIGEPVAFVLDPTGPCLSPLSGGWRLCYLARSVQVPDTAHKKIYQLQQGSLLSLHNSKLSIGMSSAMKRA